MSLKAESTVMKDYSRVVYNDRYGCAVAYYEPRMKDPGLAIIERAKKIVLPRTEKKKRDLPKPKYNVAEFLKSKEIDREIQSLHEEVDEAKTLFRKAREFNFNRHEVLFPSYKNRIHGRYVDDTIDNMNHVYEHYLKKDLKFSPEPEKPKLELKSILKQEIKKEIPEPEVKAEEPEVKFQRETSVMSNVSLSKPRPLIKSLHDKYDRLMEQRNQEVQDAMHHYARTLCKMDIQINRLRKAYKEDSDDDS